ncbi:MAG: ABC transporter ATP-binding protein [Oscillospiraceae bacterium]|jgi:zinc transport system ATP-binding protein|nr:ABC transporter ATP-binding protein [Oscillospiraceae bacterium]
MILEAKNISVTYKVGHRKNDILKDINFTIEKGEYLCIIGSNGSGKSSLMKALLGLVPCSCGEVSFKLSKNEISYLPQKNTILSDFPATVYEIVLSGSQKKGIILPFYKKENQKKALYALKLVDMLEIKKYNFGELSIGQQQRVLLARALVKEPKLIFLDEPCAALDEATSNRFYNILENLNKKQKTTVIMVSHDSSQVEKYATHVLHLDKKILFYGKINRWLVFNKSVKCIH